MGRSRAASAVEDEAGWQRSKRRRYAPESLETPTPGSSEAKRAAYHCNYCNKDVSGMIRIKCAKCADFDLCIECFSVGVEISTHKSNHPYRVIDNLSFPLIHPDWNADEEILLLEGIEMYGLGNWAEVAEHVGTKNKTRCYEHYMTEYMKSVCSPLPDMSNVAGKTKAELLALAKAYTEGKKNLLPYPDGSTPRTVKQEATISPSRIKVEDTKTEPLERSPTRVSSGLKAGAKKEVEDTEGQLNESLPSNPVSAGKKSAGSQVKEAPDTANGANPTLEDGGQSTRSLGNKKPKPAQDETKPSLATTDTTGYNAKRQEFDPEYDNDAELPLAEMEFKDIDTDADRELKLQMLHIYLARLEERKRRKDFILERGLLNVKRQQALDRKKTKEEKELIQRSRVFLRYHSSEEHEALLAGLTAEIKIRQRIEELQEYRSAGCHTLAEGEYYAMDKRKRSAEANLRKGRDALNSKMTNRSNRAINRDGAEPSSSGTRDMQRYRSGANNISKLPSVGVKTTKKSSSFSPLDLAGFPGIDLLSSTEQDLCSQLRLLPAHYLKMKEVLMLENVEKGGLRRDDACHLFKVDAAKTERVFDFLWKMGWIEASNDILPSL
ncbi:transcriptional adapter ADA2 [Selaginella moellendorffii]|uniref:transcriptional adapter ADA2 n=1 Tax=Selaginella moellendorffii TaxID=88036 RepID=UPI000D1CBC28|nr:transcriptional adapter ADA2 [Selaginella moellendorffii]XP_024544983.1 transcriptional adapter ADA2 [Selaginella moellendorffii]|eukprot:XP_024533052.1 transcriptional adapter ADA2 [Selaginella moellendorffii]